MAELILLDPIVAPQHVHASSVLAVLSAVTRMTKRMDEVWRRDIDCQQRVVQWAIRMMMARRITVAEMFAILGDQGYPVDIRMVASVEMLVRRARASWKQ